MVFLIRGFLLLILSGPLGAYAQELKVECIQEKLCPFVRPAIKKKHFSKWPFVKSAKVIEGKLLLDLFFQSDQFEIELKSSFVDKEDIIKVVKFSNLKKITNDDILLRIGLLQNYLRSKGFYDYSLSIEERVVQGKRAMTFILNIENPKIVKGINLGPNIEKLKLHTFQAKLSQLLNKSFDLSSFKVLLQDLQEDLVGMGFLYAQVGHEISEKNFFIDLSVKLDLGPKVLFSVQGNQVLSNLEIISNFKTSMREHAKDASSSFVAQKVKEYYEDFGLYGGQVQVNQIRGRTDEGFRLINYYITVKEGKKISLDFLDFSGNYHVSNEEIVSLLRKSDSPLLANMYFDQKGLKKFTQNLSQLYETRGFPHVKIHIFPPIFDYENYSTTLKVRVSEGAQYFVDKIEICQCPEEIQEKIKSMIVHKEGLHLNVRKIEADLAQALSQLKEMGHFYARFKTEKKEDFLLTTLRSNRVLFRFNIELGPRVFFEKVEIHGLKETALYVVEREIGLKKGDVVTPRKLEGIKGRLESLGLFKLVEIHQKVLRESEDQQWVSLEIHPEEKDFGSGEVAMGYRTDLGARISTDISYNNLLGKNWILSNSAQANYRFSSSTFDETRRRRFDQENDRFVEYEINTDMTFPYLYHLPIRTNVGASYFLKRLFAFDAKILGISYENTYALASHLTLGLKYRFETIDQFNGTNAKDNDSFRIGSMTPSVALDLRTGLSQIPSGAFLSVSWELANPLFLSQQEEGLTINYGRFVSRNKFYLPLGDQTSWASFFSFGVAKNFSGTKGHIPSIKGFRLGGQDNVRGHGENEINRLKGGAYVGEVKLEDSVYFVLMKSEIRYFFSDEFVAGPFVDAGRIFLTSASPLDLRVSSGLTVKYVTPVGSVDFDYGIKLSRRFLANGQRESFGRFHLSIGFF